VGEKLVQNLHLQIFSNPFFCTDVKKTPEALAIRSGVFSPPGEIFPWHIENLWRHERFPLHLHPQFVLCMPQKGSMCLGVASDEATLTPKKSKSHG